MDSASFAAHLAGPFFDLQVLQVLGHIQLMTFHMVCRVTFGLSVQTIVKTEILPPHGTCRRWPSQPSAAARMSCWQQRQAAAKLLLTLHQSYLHCLSAGRPHSASAQGAICSFVGGCMQTGNHVRTAQAADNFIMFMLSGPWKSCSCNFSALVISDMRMHPLSCICCLDEWQLLLQ